MLAGFVDHLAEFSESTSGYHDKIEACAHRISAANDIADLADVVQEVMRETRIVKLNAQRSRDELLSTRKKVEETEKRINELQEELDSASKLVRHDQLTGVPTGGAGRSVREGIGASQAAQDAVVRRDCLISTISEAERLAWP